MKIDTQDIDKLIERRNKSLFDALRLLNEYSEEINKLYGEYPYAHIGEKKWQHHQQQQQQEHKEQGSAGL